MAKIFQSKLPLYVKSSSYAIMQVILSEYSWFFEDVCSLWFFPFISSIVKQNQEEV